MTTTPTIWQGTTQANSASSGPGGNVQEEPVIVSLDNGNFVVLWQDNSDAAPGGSNGLDILGQVYHPLGFALGGTFRANQTFVGDDEQNFSATALAGGRFVVAYEDRNGNGTSIRVTEWDSGLAGVTTSVTRTILADPGEDVLAAPSVVARGDAHYVVAYQRRDVSADNVVTEVVDVYANGSVQPPQTAISGSDSLTRNVETAQALHVVKLVVVTEFDSADDSIVMRRLNNLADPAGSPIFVGDTNTNGDDDSDATVATIDGGFVVAWVNTDSNDTDIQFQRYDTDFVAQGGVVTVDGAGASDNHNEPHLISLEDGGFVLLWDDDDANVIRGKRYNSTGQAVGATFTAVDTPGEFDPTGTVLQDGRFAIAWTQSIGGQTDIEFAIWDPRDMDITVESNGDPFDEQPVDALTTGRQDGSTISGTFGDDTIFGVGGDDSIIGRGGADILNGGDGDDTISGGGSDDTITGGSGNDTLYGNTGTDSISGGLGNDWIFSDDLAIVDGGGGDDFINIEAGTINAGSGDDQVWQFGLGPQLEIDLGSGDDLIWIPSHTLVPEDNSIGFSFEGGSGNDLFTAGVGTEEVLLRHWFDMASGVYIFDAGEGAFNLAGDFNIMANFESFDGSIGDDVVFGNGAANAIRTSDGDDSLSGRGGGDTLVGGEGDDTMEGGAGGDSIIGGNGRDTAGYWGAGSGVTLDLAIEANSTGEAAGDSFSEVEIFEGSDFNDTLRGTASLETLLGGTGNDTLVGRGGVDSLLGGTGNDVLLGGAGGDILQGGVGGDFLRGDAGIDRVLYVDAASGLRVDLSDMSLNTGEAAGDNIQSVENIDGSDHFDDLRGDAEANHLRGRDGNDTLRGRGGDDTLEGGRGADVLIGQGGADHFRFTGPNQGVDTINDFVSGVDSIELLASAFGGLTPGTLPASFLRIGASAEDANDFFVYNPVNGRFFYDPGGNTGDGPVLLAVLAGSPTLVASDIELV